MIEVELPDGSIAEFPDGTPPEAMKKAIQKKFPVKPGMVEDAGRSFLSGLRQGTEGMVGMFGDANKMTGDALAWGAGKLGAGEGVQGAIRSGARIVSPFPNAPTTQELQQNITTPVVGEAYQPQTLPGEYTRTIGQFAPGAALGPGSFGQKVAMAVVPAVSSETAGQAARLFGLERYEPYARAAGAIAGGALAAGRTNPAQQAAKGAPTREALKQQTDDLYGQLRDAGIKYDSNAYGQSVVKMAADLRKAGFRESVAGDAFKVVNELADDVARGVSPDFDDINGLVESIGQKARDAARQGDNTLAKAFGIIRDNLDDLERAGATISTTPMPKAQQIALTKAARETALRNIKARTLEEVLANADTYRAGQEAGIRNGIGNLLRSKKGIQLFRGKEREALLEVANGRKALKTLSKFGFDLSKLSGNATLMPTLGIGTAYGLGGPIAGAALAAGGTAAKALSPAMTMRAFDQASAAIRSGLINAPQTQQAVRSQNIAALARLLLASKAGEASATRNAPAFNANNQ